jgi:signal transduction histidine kinase/ActR/RegA family two-component response regulator
MLAFIKDELNRDAALRVAKGLGACAFGILIASLFAQTTLFDRLSSWLYDSLQRSMGRTTDLDNVLVLDVDEESLRRMAQPVGPWRTDREVYAGVVRYLEAHGARAIAFHLLIADERPGDEALAASLGRNTVLAAAGLPVAFEAAPTYQRQLAESAYARNPPWTGAPWRADEQRFPYASWPYLRLPAQSLASGRAGVGVINLKPDEDGVLRRITLFHGTQGYVLPSLPLAALAAADPTLNPLRVVDGRLQLRRVAIPLGTYGEVALRFPVNVEDLRVIPFYEAAAAANGTPGSRWLARDVAGKVIFIGSASALSSDYAFTPVGRLSAPQIAALAYASLTAGQVATQAGLAIDGLLLLGALFVPLFLMRRGVDATGRALLFALLATPLALAGAGAGLYAIGIQSKWLFAAVAGLTSLAVVLSLWLYAVSDERRRLRYETLAERQANRLKSEFLNHLTHELRTPLTAIMGFNKLNQFTDDLGRESRIHNSAIIGRNCEHLLALINNNLDLAKIEAGTLVIALASEDPEQLVRDVIATMQPLADDKRLRLRFTRGTTLPPALALDAFRVRQILMNLLSNALKFTPSGTVELVASWHLAALQIEIRDTGPGIPDDALARIFEPFEQADASIAQRYGGTGLGLAITRNLVSLMNGTIEVESKRGVGSTFRVRIPSEATARVETVRPITEALVAREPLAGRVLVGEDNDDIRTLVELFLTRLGVETRAVANGFSAVEAALAERFDVVLLDMEMPVMNGYEAVHVLRTRNYTGPILAFTAHHDGLEADRARAAGCDGIVAKPISLEGLRNALRPLLREPRKVADIAAGRAERGGRP